MRTLRKTFGKLNKRCISISVLIFFAFSFSQPFLSQWKALAENPPEPKTADYKIPADVIDSGGGEKAKSNNYVLDDSIGEPNIGWSNTADYTMNAGYRQAAESGPYLSLTCSSSVTIPSVVGTGQGTGEGTCTVQTDSIAGYNLQWSAQSAGWLSGWNYRKEMTISKTNVDSALTDFPLLVKITNDTAIGPASQSNGYDIRFTSSTGALLKYEREKYEYGSGSGSGVFWVKVPVVNSASDTTIYVYYGNPSASDGQNVHQVWDSNFKGVWHMSGATLHTTDSTSNGNNGTNNGVTATAGQMDGGASFGGVNDVNVGNKASLNLSGQMTLSAWVKTTVVNSTYDVILSKNSPSDTFQLGINATGNKMYFQTWNTDGATKDVFSDNVPSTSTWYYLSGVMDASNNLKLYVNGSQQIDTDTLAGTLRTNEANVMFGQVSGNYYLNGSLDEVRVSDTARSAAWIKFEYYNMNSANNEATWSGQQAEGSDSANMVSEYGDTIAPYTPAVAETAETWSVAATDSEWGGRLSSDSTDTASRWGTDDSSEKWLNIPTTNYTIVTRSSRTEGNGSTELLQYRAEVGASKHQPTGKYSATVTVTAVAL
ncbi:hypothetical protein A3A67_02190 [Candidatus Peribacteria bacterium RIFCSPLOWO2_01_FULL_51_18]|nr:MAG: hypothetical protein A3C52_02715 [Candidatus Peribacteria bacterium RIFCSPHIGHO2_02_FULL_51_15]OGJ66547.1 MAG: hypothetical protein A3A67_02190 [Candidatus Peribacteria bacterium RIFCSPLOWO2_01_FULL_51_18]OGJ69866.1 MAG: hypothetical protein A3J34_02995 [Candidatus Peribacteria bacterium RIFCSPLOWO2_02_FULL_51_10]